STPASAGCQVGTRRTSPRSSFHAHNASPHHRSKPGSRVMPPSQSAAPSWDAAATNTMQVGKNRRNRRDLMTLLVGVGHAGGQPMAAAGVGVTGQVVDHRRVVELVAEREPEAAVAFEVQ